MGFTGSFLLKSNQQINKEDTIFPFKLLEEVSFSNKDSEIILQATPVEGFHDILSVWPYNPKEHIQN